MLFRQSEPFVEVLITLQNFFQKDKKGKEKTRAVDAPDNRRTEQPPRKCFICGYEDHLIAKFPNPPKDNEKRREKVRLNEKGNHACENRENNSDQKIYAYMARMSGNEECPSKIFGDSSQWTNCILDSGSTCHMTPQVSGFITGSLEGTDKYIGVVEGHHVTAKQKGQRG